MDERRRQLLLRKKELLLQKKAAMHPKSQRPESFGNAGAFLLGAGQSVPVTEEIGSALGTLFSKPLLEAREAITGQQAPSWGELYSRELDKTRGQIKQAAENNPLEYYGGMIAGSIGTGMAGAGTKAGSNLATRLGSGGLPMRIAKGVGAGATSGGIYGFAAGEGGIDERLSSAGQGAVLGGATGGLLPAVGGAVKGAAKGINARGANALEESLGAITERSNAGYAKMRELGATFTRPAASKIFTKTNAAMKESGPLVKEIHGQSMGLMDSLQKRIASGEIGRAALESSAVQEKDIQVLHYPKRNWVMFKIGNVIYNYNYTPVYIEGQMISGGSWSKFTGRLGECHKFILRNNGTLAASWFDSTYLPDLDTRATYFFEFDQGNSNDGTAFYASGISGATTVSQINTSYETAWVGPGEGRMIHNRYIRPFLDCTTDQNFSISITADLENERVDDTIAVSANGGGQIVQNWQVGVSPVGGLLKTNRNKYPLRTYTDYFKTKIETSGGARNVISKLIFYGNPYDTR